MKSESVALGRREFLAGLAVAGGALLYPAWGQEAHVPDGTAIQTVYVVWKCHLDLGFTTLAHDVIQKYFEVYLPQAMALGEELEREGKGDSFVWTTGSWLITEFLERAAPSQRARMENALAKGHIAWHALPHSFQSELMSRDLLLSALQISADLDRRFGKKTTGAKMTDVPGHSRGLIAPLAEAGVRFLDIGGNPGSAAPHTPPLFLWREPGGAELCVLNHGAYGETLVVPGSDFALCINVWGDNGGVPTLAELHEFLDGLRERFPAARLQMASLSDVANAMETVRDNLPVWTGEIGDTWIHGAASDPLLMAQSRELYRLHSHWLRTGQIQRGDTTDLAFTRRLSLVPEHTWGLDIKTFLKDFDIYKRPDFDAARSRPNFRLVESSWAEKRARIEESIAVLPVTLQVKASRALTTLHPAPTIHEKYHPFNPTQTLITQHFHVRLDPTTGALIQLKHHTSGRDWASAKHPLGTVAYQTFDAAAFDHFTHSYCQLPDEWWVQSDFGKPGLEKTDAKALTRVATLQSARITRARDSWHLHEDLIFEGSNLELEAPPRWVTLDWFFPDNAPEVHLSLQWFDKSANRLPEALWLSFAPIAPHMNGWTLDKMGQPISPLEVVEGGNRQMHAVGSGLSYQDESGHLEIETLDAPLVTIGDRDLLNYSHEMPDPRAGMHFNLWNNVWGTNYRMWFEEDMKFRFKLRF